MRGSMGLSAGLSSVRRARPCHHLKTVEVGSVSSDHLAGGWGRGGGHSQAGAESLVAKISSVAELCACATQRMLRAVVGVAPVVADLGAENRHVS